MTKIDISLWGEYRLGTLFHIRPTKAYKLNNSLLYESDGKNPVIVNSSYNSGVGGYTNKPTTEEGNIITFSDTTSAEAIFYQEKAFVGYPHVQGLYPVGKYKNLWGKYSLLFLVSVFRQKAIGLNYNYVNKFTRESASKINVKLPIDQFGDIDFPYMESFMKKIEIKTAASLNRLLKVKSSKNLKKLDISNWGTFHLYDIFKIDPGTKLDKVKMDTTVEKINFVGRSNFNNGITQRVNTIEGLKPYSSGNLTLALGGAYLGSCFVQRNDFYTSQNVVVLIPKTEMTMEAKQFIATAIFKESQNNYKAFIRELNRHINKDFTIKLPVMRNGKPDLDYMTSYMQNIYKKTTSTIKKLRTLV